VSVHPSKAIHDLSAPVLADCASASSATVEQRAARHRALSLKRQAGQGMTEYIIIVALVAVAAIAVYQYLGQVLRAQTAAVAKELAGEDGTQQSRAAQSAAESAATQAAAKSLKDFTGQGQGSGR
jgi:type IV pilus assembly protein PilA